MKLKASKNPFLTVRNVQNSALIWWERLETERYELQVEARSFFSPFKVRPTAALMYV